MALGVTLSSLASSGTVITKRDMPVLLTRRASLWYASLNQTFYKDLSMRKPTHGLTNHTQPVGGASDTVPLLQARLRFLHQPKMAAATDQRIIVAH